MRKLIFTLTVLYAPMVSAQMPKMDLDQVQRHDDEVRARNAETDFFFVSSVMTGLKQIRMYVDRNTVRASSSYGRAWVDVYQVVDAKRPLRLQHSKALGEVQCGEIPQMRFKMMVTYKSDGTTNTQMSQEPWVDVIPGSSQETIHRFICHDEPANAFYPVFNGNTPEKDAMAYFLKQP